MLALCAILAASGCGGSGDSGTSSDPAKTTTGTASTQTGKARRPAAGANVTTTTAPSTTKTSPSGGRRSGRSSSPEGSGNSKFAGVYAEALRVCSQGTVEKVAHNVGIKSTNRARIARAMAHGYLPRFRKQALAGCSAGLSIAAGLK